MMPWINCRKEFFDDAHFAGHALAPLFVDDAALLIDFLGVESEGACPVMEDDKTRVLDTFAGDRHIIYIIDCLVDVGIGVEIVAEAHANRLEPVDK